MDDYTALSDNLIDDFIVSGNFQEDIVIKTLKVQTWKDFSRICGKISPENYPWRNPFFSKVDNDGSIGICNKIVCLTIADKYRKYWEIRKVCQENNV